MNTNGLYFRVAVIGEDSEKAEMTLGSAGLAARATTKKPR
jgi:hypothetical protein